VTKICIQNEQACPLPSESQLCNFSKWPTWHTIPLFYKTFITVLYMFRATSCSGRPLTESDHTRYCINTIWLPDDEQDVAWNM